MTSVTLSDLLTKTRRRAGIETSSYIVASDDSIVDAELTDYINEAAAYLHQRLVDTSEDYYVTRASFTVANGASSFSLPSDFFKFRALDVVVGDGYVSVEDNTISERNDHRGIYGVTLRWSGPNLRYELLQDRIELLPERAAAGTYVLRYTPTYTVLSSPSDQVSFPEQWHEFVVCYAAKLCLINPKVNNLESAAALDAHLAKLEQNIMRSAVSRGQPRRMLRTRTGRHGCF